MLTETLSVEIRESLGQVLVAPEEIFELLVSEQCEICCYAGGGGCPEGGSRAQ
jgi:hypothetical protein